MFPTVFSTAPLPPDERLALFDELQATSDHPMRAFAREAATFTADIGSLDLASVNIVELTCSPADIVRTGRLVRDFDPELYSVVMTRSGRVLLEQGGEQAVLDTGSMALYTSSQPFRVQIEAPGAADGPGATASLLRVQVPKSLLQLPSQRLDRTLARPLSATTGIGALFTRVLDGLAADSGSYTPGDLTRVGTIVTDLMTATLASQLDLDTPATVAEATLTPQIMTFIERHLSDPDLTPRAIASAHHISVSYLHRLFRAHDTTVGTWIRNQRLEHARRDLTDPHLASLAIHRIASRWGFGDHATFTRAFRKQFGTSPRDYRQDPDLLVAEAPPGLRGAVGLGPAAALHPSPPEVAVGETASSPSEPRRDQGNLERERVTGAA